MSSNDLSSTSLLGAYALATTQLGFSVHATLLSSTILPLVMLLSYFILLPLGPLQGTRLKYQAVESEDEDHSHPRTDPIESAGLLAQPEGRSISPAYTGRQSWSRRAWIDLRSKLIRAQALVIPYVEFCRPKLSDSWKIGSCNLWMELLLAKHSCWNMLTNVTML